MKELEEATISTQRQRYTEEFRRMKSGHLLDLAFRVRNSHYEKTELEEMLYALAERFERQDYQ